MTDPRLKLVVLGTGFEAFNLVKDLDSSYRLAVVSPRNHFLFTPLLPSTTVGTVIRTFNVPGAADHALFLKELNDARELRRKIILAFERANLPSRPPKVLVLFDWLKAQIFGRDISQF